MCTVTWMREQDGYQLFCNRDEKLTRRLASPPKHDAHGGIRYMAPIDGDFGGTWIATNEFGVTLCLLNGANLNSVEATERSRDFRSRGLLIPALIGASSVGDAERSVSGRDLSQFAPFTLVMLDRAQPPAIVEWNGRQTFVTLNGDQYLPLASSSVNGETARTMRREEYCRLIDGQPNFWSLFKFHRSHAFGPGPYSPCMHRDDAETVSFTHVRVTASRAAMFYSPSAACGRAPGVTAELSGRQ